MKNQIIKQSQNIAEKPKTVTDEVLERVRELQASKELVIPENYAAQNALKSAYLILQETKDKNKRCVLETCTKVSIATSLLDMIIQGLSPSKKQCYFIPHGNKLQLTKSYMGTIAAAKRSKYIKDVKAYCIYEGDEVEFEYKNGNINVIDYKPDLKNIDNSKIIGAFAVVIGEEGVLHTEYMSMAQIKTSWAQGPTKGKSPSHINFPDQMAKRTVINRACKLYINTSDDSELFASAFNRSPYSDDEDVVTFQNEAFESEITEKANKKTIDIDEVEQMEAEIIDEDTKIDAEVVEETQEEEDCPF